MPFNVGINSVARNGIGAYVGVGNVARKVIAGWAGVNGVARQFYTSYDPFRDIVETVAKNTGVSYRGTGTFGNLTGTNKWFGGVTAPNGKIYGIPRDSTSVLEIDPVARTATTFGNLTGAAKWCGGAIATNGKIYGIPVHSATVLELTTTNPVVNFQMETLLSGYLNKF